MNSAESEGRQEKRRGRNERDREARVRETAEEREARLARRRQQDRARRERAQAQETPEQREARLSNQREENRARRDLLPTIVEITIPTSRYTHSTCITFGLNHNYLMIINIININIELTLCNAYNSLRSPHMAPVSI